MDYICTLFFPCESLCFNLCVYISYRTNCSVNSDVLCLGNRRFSRNKLCNWTGGYRWSTALALSI